MINGTVIVEKVLFHIVDVAFAVVHSTFRSFH